MSFRSIVFVGLSEIARNEGAARAFPKLQRSDRCVAHCVVQEGQAVGKTPKILSSGGETEVAWWCNNMLDKPKSHYENPCVPLA